MYRYFEVVETYRRLTLTAVISVLGNGDSGQQIVAIIISFAFMELYASCDPYRLRQAANISRVGQYQVFLTFLGALIIDNSLLGADRNNLGAVYSY